MDNRKENFLKELGELTLKYEMEIGGCGCCGSPWVYDLIDYMEVKSNLFFDKKDGVYK